MRRLVLIVGLAMLLCAAGAFSWGVVALNREQDLLALYCLICGAAFLNASSGLLRTERS